MHARTLAILISAAALPVSLFAQGQQQATPDRIEISVSRSVTLKIEEAGLAVTIAAPTSATLDSVVKATETVGVKETDLQGVNPYFGTPAPGGPSDNRVVYNFIIRVPSAQLPATLQKLDQLRRTLLAGESGMELVGQNVIGFGASDRSREAARTQLLSDALGEARARAETLAKAAGLQLGAIVGVNEAFSGFASGGIGIGGIGIGGAPLSNTAGVYVLVRFAVSR